MPVAWVGAAVGAYNALSGPSSSDGSSGGSNNAYIPINRPGMDTSFQNQYNQYGNTLNTLQGQTGPASQQTFQGQFNNPYAGGYLSGANQAGQAYGRQASQLGQQSNQSYGAANQIYQQAFDPQSALYNQEKQELTDSARAAQYARGIQSSPYGASVESNALGNFQNQWQNQQLAREREGIAAMNSANQAGMNLGQAGAYSYNLSGQIPYGAQNSIYGNQNQAIQNLYGNYSPYLQGLQQQQSNALGYLNNAQSAQNQAFQQGIIGQQNMQNTANSLGQAAVQGYNAWNNGNSFQNAWNTNVTNANPSGSGMGSADQGLGAYNIPGYGGGGV